MMDPWTYVAQRLQQALRERTAKLNTFDEMVDFYRDQKEMAMHGQRGWGFGVSHNQRSTFVDEDAHNAYMEHVRVCPKRHDPRGKRYGGCAEVPDHWFAPDSAEDPT